jgi:hypothetical protein
MVTEPRGVGRDAIIGASANTPRPEQPWQRLALTLVTRDYDYVHSLALRDVVAEGTELTVIRAMGNAQPGRR